MARARTKAVPDWAADATVVPLRRASRAELAQLSARRGLGFDAAELARIHAYFRNEGREPTDVELTGLAQSWSEHCSYKSSRPFLKKAFSGLRPTHRVLGTGDAGVMKFENGYAYALRIESHNHPSAVEPYGGAATGIGGILRDVLAVGAKPIALSDPLFFGPLDLPAERVPSGVKSPRYLATGVIAGIRDYGNRVGVPTVSGGIYFDPAYTVNPLVNVGCVGFLPRRRLLPNRAKAVGDRLVLVGGLTGRDGIGGVAFASTELTDRSESESRGAVQLGNPIMKEPLMHACLESFDRGLVRGLKDLGGGGIASAFGELVHAGGFGMRIDLARVPLREEGLRPWEVFVSESQERMVLDVRPADLPAVTEIFERFDVPITDLGEVTEPPFETIEWHGAPVAHLRVGFRVAPPSIDRPFRPRVRVARPAPAIPDDDLAGLFSSLVLAPDSASREPVVRVYDHEVQGRTVIRPLHGAVGHSSHGDAAVIQPRPESRRGLAIATAAQPWLCREDPRAGAIAVVEEGARNLYAVGAKPDAFTNCLNFGNPEDPAVLGDFSEVTQGLAAGARALGFAVPSGNVSLYNGGLNAAILPTPVLMCTGIVPDLDHAVTSDLKEAGDVLYLVGRSRPELGGSLWARARGLTDLAIPPPSPATLRTDGERLLTAMGAGIVRAAHDISDGGLAVTLAEMAFGGPLGVDVDLAAVGLATPGLVLAAEGGSRFVVELPAGSERRFLRTMGRSSVARIGEVAPTGASLAWGGRPLASIDLDDLYARWRVALGLP
ncbi:MAG TPA: phosphoribosylformylglycinamidine synthase subunit PurL [Thermoplasmata archaeon]|nr:phosphoribosylformylglycinamidine synthase subunit PurL [Thermoplasmata archaeon]